MKIQQNIIKPASLLSITAYTAVFFLWQVIYSFASSEGFHIYFNEVILNPSVHLPFKFYLAASSYWLMQIVLCVTLSVTVYCINRLISSLFQLSKSQSEKTGLALCLLSFIAIMFANQIYYPLSIFSTLMQQSFSAAIAKNLLAFCLLLLSASVALAAVQIIKHIWNFRLFKTVILAALLFSVSGTFIYHRLAHAKNNAPYHKQPNVIIIGLDAVRPDYITPEITPTLYSFINNSAYFSNSFTPLARTFPAWISILTGLYPKHHGARFTFKPSFSLPISKMLPTILAKHGYTSVYSTDDSEFDYFDSSYNFSKTITPRKGAPGYFINCFSDLPAANLVMNSRLGALLFPYTYASRPAFITYRPKTFIYKVNKELNKIKNRPLFLAIHFCLPHWPYLWADSKITNASTKKMYSSSLSRMDQQFAGFLHLLQQQRLLDNAIVIALSDHGESLSEHGDRIITRKKYIRGLSKQQHLFQKLAAIDEKNSSLDVSSKHGTDVLSLSQNKNFLALRFYGKEKNTIRTISAPVSLIDIKPTVLQILGIVSVKGDGVSLLPAIKHGKTSALNNRPIFFETGLSPSSLKKRGISLKDIASQSIPILQIDPKTLLVSIRKNIMQELLLNKQRAIFYKNWLLALYPQEKGETIAALVNCQTHQWTDDLHSKFAASSPVSVMIHALKNFYKEEVNFNQSRKI